MAWELGSGLGHARRLLAIAGALRRRGWSPIVAARELWACADEYRLAGVPTLQAPLGRGLTLRESAQFRARNLSDIIAASGYRHTEELLTIVSAWDRLIDMIRPAIIVVDYSPILALAAYGRVPTVAIGDGFVLPPPQLSQMPVLRSGTSEMPAEDQLLANASVVQRQRGLPAPPSLPALIGGAAHVVCTYPETDIYSDYRAAAAEGPVTAPPPRLGRPDRTAVFAYLAADTGRSAKLMQVLINSRVPVEAFLRAAPATMKQALRRSGVHVHDIPPALAEVAKRASVIVHHGGIGTIETCLALGRPQVLMPRHLEQWQNAMKVARLGTAAALGNAFTLAEGSRLIGKTVSSVDLFERAQHLAARLIGRPASLEQIAAHCERLADV